MSFRTVGTFDKWMKGITSVKISVSAISRYLQIRLLQRGVAGVLICVGRKTRSFSETSESALFIGVCKEVI